MATITTHFNRIAAGKTRKIPANPGESESRNRPFLARVLFPIFTDFPRIFRRPSLAYVPPPLFPYISYVVYETTCGGVAGIYLFLNGRFARILFSLVFGSFLRLLRPIKWPRFESERNMSQRFSWMWLYYIVNLNIMSIKLT